METSNKENLPLYLQGLNTEQLKAVLHTDGNLLILAGAGSGKTRVITTKIAYLIKEKHIAPESILAVTFTNKAANEMRERACVIEPSCERANLRTFHSFGAWFLRRNALAAGLDRNFTIYDDEDSLTLLRAANPDMPRSDAKKLMKQISYMKDMGLSPDSKGVERGTEKAFASYEERLRASGNVDFGDLITIPVKVLQNNEAIAQRIRSRFKVILVDEYQDANSAQFQLLKALSSPETYVCVVGDDDQSIYGFRGADIRNIQTFEQSFPNTSLIKLEQNYRSYQSILDIASAVVENNSGRIGKKLKAVRKGGTLPVVANLSNSDEELEFVEKIINKHIMRGGQFSDIAILYRTNAQSRNFELQLPKSGIPIRVVGSLRFYEREEVKDAISLLSMANNPFDEVAFRRIANKPVRGVGEKSLEFLLSRAYDDGIDYISASLSEQYSKSAKASKGLRDFAKIIKSIVESLGGSIEPVITKTGSNLPFENDSKLEIKNESGNMLSNILEQALNISGLRDYHKMQDEIAGSQKEANLDELINAASDYPATKEGLTHFLEDIQLDIALTNANENPNSVTLITIHNSKGLEFPVVIVTGMEQGIFPRDNDESELEENRRLFYVAMTRAKDELFLTYCKLRMVRGKIDTFQPSLFLSEIPKKLIDQVGGNINYSVTKEASKWKKGQHVYHDDYGSGYVVKVSTQEESGVLLVVQFETGKIAQFFPKYTKKLELLGNDDY